MARYALADGPIGSNEEMRNLMESEAPTVAASGESAAAAVEPSGAPGGPSRQGSEQKPMSVLLEEEVLTQLIPLVKALSPGGSPAPAQPSPAQPSTPTAVTVGALRGRIFSALKSNEFAALRQLLPEYGEALEYLVQDASADRSTVQRLECDHKNFFEQLKAALITNRIQIRLELERVKASQLYAEAEPADRGGSWQG
ncbi:MAG: hypothetical protein U5J83_13960 [Bryobacterales bacterium]|nr:hypothetical protein [Bryobacterales bacterium]